MPKSTSGGSKVPVRGLTSLLRELDPATKNTLNSAFSDAETLLDFHSRSVPERQRRRRISGLVNKIVLTGRSNLLGGFLEWRRLDDPRISMYEAQISDDDIFANPETLTVLETFLALENLRTIKFARVRGVQANGNTGLWSNTVRISPRTSAPTVYSLDFYQRYFGAEPKLRKFLRYSGGLSHLDWTHPQFYTVLKGDFYVDRLVGALSIYGYICSRLKNFADCGFTPWDRVRFKVDGITRMDGYFPHWTTVQDANFPSKFHNNDFHRTTGAKMTFYLQGGYTASFGPYAVTIPNTLNGLGPNDPRAVAQMDTLDGAFYWYDVRNALRASRYDEAQLDSWNDTRPAHEAFSDAISEGGLTDWIIFRDYRMEVPEDATILGIEAKIKRRQANILNDNIPVNFGVKRTDRTTGFTTVVDVVDPTISLPDNFVLEHMATTGGNTNVQSSHIFDDIDFGRGLDLTCGRVGLAGIEAGNLRMDLTGVGNDGSARGHNGTNFIQTSIWTGDEFTIAAWIRCPTPVSSYFSGTQNSQLVSLDAFNIAPNVGASVGGNSLVQGITLICSNNATTNRIATIQCTLNISNTLIPVATNTCTFTTTPPTGTVNAWHHVAVVWSRAGIAPTSTAPGIHRLFVDGVLRVNGTPSVNWRGRNFFPSFMNMAVGTVPQGTAGAGVGQSIMSMAHVGVWDTMLSADEIAELYVAKGRVDYRHNFGDYVSALQLNHYFLVFPERTDIRDHQVCLVDENGMIRTDLENKAVDESWPQLAQFFYTDLRQHGFLPLAVSDGPTHDNHTAIGYQTYGGELDQWGGVFTPEQVNSFYFGVAVRATNAISLGYRGDAFIDHAKLTIYTNPRFDRTVNVRAEVAVSNQFYLEREIFGGIMNLIELGEKFEENEL